MEDKELEEAIQRLKFHKEYAELQNGTCIVNTLDLEKVLQALENSIPKEAILDKIRGRQFELQQQYIDFKDDIILNTLQDILEGK